MKIQNTMNYSSNKLKILIYGESGVGKTSLAKTITDKTLIISAEAGLLSLNDSNIDVIDITQDNDGKPILKEKRIQRLVEAYQYLLTDECKKKYQWIFIDSLTEISQAMIDSLNVEFPERKDSLVLYGENSKRMNSLIKSFRDIPFYNVVFTALPEIDKDENGFRFTTVQMVGSIAKKLPAFFDEVFYLFINDEAERLLLCEKSDKVIAKDRSGKLDRLEKPNLAQIARKIKGEEDV
jgi:phage nucleotide-binding protein